MKAFENAVRLVMVTGGSTNATIHLIAMARSAGVEGVSIDRPGDLGDAILAGIKSNRPYLIDANISGDLNPPGAGVWEIPGLGINQPAIGKRFIP